MRQLARHPWSRRFAIAAIALLLAGAIVVQRSTVIDALRQLRSYSTTTLLILMGLAIVERVSRAEVIRSLLPGTSLARSEVIGDVGAAVSKGVPAGGPIATVLRWQIARDGGVGATSFVRMLLASGVATAFVSWGYALVATLADIGRRDADLADLAIIGLTAMVLSGSVIFWTFALFSTRAERWIITRAEWVRRKFSGAVPDFETEDAAQFVTEVRESLRTIARRPGPLLVRTMIAQGTGVVILWVALRGLGVGSELGVTEFARVFFVAHVLGSIAPTPGGVGVIEAGLTGALVAAGVQIDVALAGVLVYRFITYVLPILVGALLFVVWRRTRVRPKQSVVQAVRFSAEPTGR